MVAYALTTRLGSAAIQSGICVALTKSGDAVVLYAATCRWAVAVKRKASRTLPKSRRLDNKISQFEILAATIENLDYSISINEY